VRGFIGDDEYLAKRQALDLERLELGQRREEAGKTQVWIELSSELEIFVNRAPVWFASGSQKVQRMILETIGLNFSLTDKKLLCKAKRPFPLRAEELLFTYMWRWGGLVRNHVFAAANTCSRPWLACFLC
jgi:hypothetical protein